MDRCTGSGGRWRGAGVLVAVLLAACGCNDDRYSHEPPPGQGTLYVENYTGDRVQVYLDGAEVDSVARGKRRYYDLEPGIRRVALDGRNVQRSWVGDIDVLEGRRTVMEVRSLDTYSYTFDIRYFFD